MEFLQALLFYAVFSLFGVFGLAVSMRFIPHKTLAYAVSKPAGLILFGYTVWFMASFKLLDYQNKLFIGLLFLFSVFAGIYLCRDFLKENKKKILLAEGCALLAYLVYLFFRSWNPAINGTERFMDMALLAASGKTHYFPFIDMWYAGKTINYYYYGSYLMSLVSNLSGIPYALTYNFALGILYCESALLSAAIVFALTGRKFISVLSAFLVTSAGTIFFAVASVMGYFSGHLYTYASSTRLYTPSYIINEIPSYSFTVGDLHAHFLALPFFLFDLALIYVLALSKKMNWAFFAFLSLAVATSGMINLWDAITVYALIFMVLIFKSGKWLGAGLFMAVLSLIFMWPNLKNFQSPVLGLKFIPSYIAKYHLSNIQWPTPFLAELGMWGIFLAGIIFAFYLKRKNFRDFYFVASLGAVALGIIIGVELFFIEDIYGVTNPPYFRANTTFKFGYHAWVMLSLAFSVAAAALIRRPDNLRYRDPALARRMGWCMLSLAVIAGAFYPYQAFKQFYLPTGKMGELDGSVWMKTQSPEDWNTVQYINKNIPERSVIAEAVGDSYTTYARISAFSGMITPMGWKTHEWTWRFDASAVKNAVPGQAYETGWGAVSGVATDIQRLYETTDVFVADGIIRKYGIQYVYIGGLERTAYKNLSEQKFAQLGEIVFHSGASTLYKIER
ncbi:MAG: DUF2298 domain-containing protein [bacterium]|nr:DUF2298 domain-containing protein [bacterium]